MRGDKFENLWISWKLFRNNIYFTKKKYSDYDGYLREDFYRRLQSELLKFQEDGSNINLEVYLMMKSNNLVFKELGSLCNDGNLDLEIELIDKLSPIVKSIFRRMGLSLEKWMELGEDVIIKALETYNGEKTFSFFFSPK